MKPNPETRPEADGAREDALYFDDEATVLARPVVPLEQVAGDSAPPAPGQAHAPAPGPQAGQVAPLSTAGAASQAATPAYDATASGVGTATANVLRRERGGMLRSVPLALVLTAVMAGVVIGGVGFYLFQQRLRTEPAAEPATEQPAVAQSDDSQPASDVPQETAEAAPVVAAEPPAAPVEEKADEEEPDAAPAASAASAPARARTNDARPAEPQVRTASVRAENTRRENRDDEDSRRDRDSARRPAREQEPEARRVDSIIYQRQRREQRREQRRAERRERRSVDSVRGIFEGGP
jgi:hypothetical protein